MYVNRPGIEFFEDFLWNDGIVVRAKQKEDLESEARKLLKRGWSLTGEPTHEYEWRYLNGSFVLDEYYQFRSGRPGPSNEQK